MVPTLLGKSVQRESTVYIEYQEGRRTPAYEQFHPSHRNRKRGQMQAIICEGYKGVRYDVQSANDNFLIYDTQTDPGETANLAGTAPQFERLQEQMKARALQVRRPNPTASRPYDNAPVPPVKEPGNARPGLLYRAFEVRTPWTPDVETLRLARRWNLPSQAQRLSR
jgi:hypothetical protein